jgi:two-component system, OmpR family, sensor histidine kinase MtrB
VITNVVGNARRHGRPPIRVTAEQLDRFVRINVSDQGEGVPDDLVPRLFERFERGSEGGAGLGLAIAKTYAVAHGGDLLYHGGEQGARFELVLPAR